MIYTEIDKKLVRDFLTLNYPISRVKHEHRFKRAIVLDSGETFFLSEVNTRQYLKLKLVEILHVIFSFNVMFLKEMVDSFLPF